MSHPPALDLTDIDPLWLARGEQRQVEHLFKLLVPRVEQDETPKLTKRSKKKQASLSEPGNATPLIMLDVDPQTNIRQALQYLRDNGVNLGPVHVANRHMHDVPRFAKHRWCEKGEELPDGLNRGTDVTDSGEGATSPGTIRRSIILKRIARHPATCGGCRAPLRMPLQPRRQRPPPLSGDRPAPVPDNPHT